MTFDETPNALQPTCPVSASLRRAGG
jgi:hypothetical protein